MRLIISVFALAVLGALAMTACNSAEQRNGTAGGARRTSSGPAPVFADGVRRVTIEELNDMLAKNEAVVVDVRNEASYRAGHLPGSRLIPESDVGKRSDELPKDKLIVTYCS